ncbi:DUF3987 domain-containing protein [Burkholderia vietnamiensis]|uniref:DUF3987 domain-containing protein n=1 Tax=Burkholderia vietnamiensis TaxID=60552 RepID=UPI001B90B8B3|nr:DUF3987 domain-containing protein [Burkholderia vietnamiensis]MBR8163967.1 DUF3987 domain-containing protein [Burkholderia vietnamiensis]
MRGNPFPLYALSSKQRALIEAVARSSAFECMLAGNTDGHIAKAVGPCVAVKTPDGRQRDPYSCFMIVGRSGAGKSPAAEPFMQHFNGLVAAHDTATLSAWQEHKGRMAAWQAEYSGTERAINKRATKGLPPDDAFVNRLVELERDRPEVPPSPPRVLDKFTFAAVKELAEKNRALLVGSDEGSALLAELEKDLIALLCSSWSGVPISFSRSGTGVQLVQPKMTVILSIQTLTLLQYLQTPRGKHFLDSGSAARFLWYAVDESMVEPARSNLPDIQAVVEMQEFLDRCAYFFHEQVRLQQVGWEGRKILTFTPRGCQALDSAYRRVRSIRLEGLSSSELACIEKLSEQIIRHAARHHEFDGEEGAITAERVECAEEIVLWSYDNFSRLINAEAQAMRHADKDADQLFDVLFYGLRVRGKVSLRVLRDEAFNIGLVGPTQFNAALGVLCTRNQVYVKDGYVHLIRPDDLVNVLGRGGVH